MTAPASAPVYMAASPRAPRLRDANAGRTLAALGGLMISLPVDLVLVGLALAARSRYQAPRPDPGSRRTVLITGGKMTKALQLARCFHAAGQRVVLVESAKYRFTGHRFSRAVDAFHCVPEPTAQGYVDALVEIARRERVDVFVPVSSPAASRHDAAAGCVLAEFCDVIHGDVDTVRRLDDKVEFSRMAASLGLCVPDWHRITDPRQVEEFDFPEGRTYILKRISYNPVGRMDLTKLSGATPEANAKFARSLPISAEDPWILQQFVAGREYCTHGTVRDGQLQVYGCSRSSAFQINYESVDKPEIRSWVEYFVGALNLTGQASFDFIEAGDGHVYAIECNPRTHSAITMFHNHPHVAAAYLEAGHHTITPRADARPTYWIYHELWRLLTQSDRASRIATILLGRDAIFSWRDPLPYLMVHHLQIPSLLVANLRSRRGWTRIDFNIGKLVEMGGE